MIAIQNHWEQLKREGRQFLSWWLNQLIDVWRAILHFVMPSSRLTGVIEVNAQGVSATLLHRGKQVRTQHLLAENQDWYEQLKHSDLLSGLKIGRVRVVLGTSLVLHKDVLLPETTESNLAQVLRFKLEREFPLSLDAIRFESSVVERLRAEGKIRVAISIVKSELVDTVARKLEEMGLTVAALTTLDKRGRILGSFLKSRSSIDLRLSRLERRLALICVGLAITCGVIVLSMWGSERYQMSQKLAAIEHASSAAETIANHIDEASKPANQLFSIASYNDAADYIHKLTDATPSGTWVNQLSVHVLSGNDVTFDMTAFTPPSLDYIKKLESTMAFHDIKLIETSAESINPSTHKVVLKASSILTTRQVPMGEQAMSSL